MKFGASYSKPVLMIGTDPGGQGGVAAVVETYRRAALFEHGDVRYVSTHRGGSLITKLASALSGGFRIAALLATGRVRLVHAHVSSHGSFRRKAIYLALARWLGVPTVFHLHSGGFRQFVEQQASPRLRRLILRTVQQSSLLVGLSDAWAGYLRTLAPGVPVVVLPNPVDVPDVSLLREGEAGRLLFLGRASDSKGIYDLLEAFAAVVARHAHARLAIGGDGDLERLRRRIGELGLQDHVEVLGWVAGRDKQTQFQRCQVYVLPSYHEGLPVGMLEAMAFGKAVVVTPVGGVPDAVNNRKHGLLVQPGDVAALAVAVAELVQNTELRLALGAAARQRVMERYSTDRVLRQLAAIHEQALNSQRGLP